MPGFMSARIRSESGNRAPRRRASYASPGDDRDGDDARQDAPQQSGGPEEREHEDRHDHHDDQEVRAAPDMLLRVRLDPVRAPARPGARTRRSSCARRRGTRRPGGSPSSDRSATGSPRTAAPGTRPRAWSPRRRWRPTLSSIQVNRVVGPRMNTPTNRSMATASETPTCRDVSCSSSSSEWLAETMSAFTPIASD